MPFSPAAPASKAAPTATENAAEPTMETKITTAAADDTWQQEKQVRLAEQRILSEHLREPTAAQQPADSSCTRFWPGMRLDLTGEPHRLQPWEVRSHRRRVPWSDLPRRRRVRRGDLPRRRPVRRGDLQGPRCYRLRTCTRSLIRWQPCFAHGMAPQRRRQGRAHDCPRKRQQ